MKEAIRGKLKQENQAIAKGSKEKANKVLTWTRQHKKNLTIVTSLMGVALFVVSLFLQNVKELVPSLYQSINCIQGQDMIRLTEASGWNFTSIGFCMFLYFYIWPWVSKFLMVVWRPVRYILLHVLIICIWAMTVLGIGANSIKWLRKVVPALRKSGTREKEESTVQFEKFKAKRMQNTKKKKDMVQPFSVQLIAQGPVHSFKKKPEDTAKKKALGETVKERFLKAAELYQMDFINIVEVVKGPSATILSCDIGSHSIHDIKKRDIDIVRTLEVDWIKVENAGKYVNIVVPCWAEEREFVYFGDVMSEFKAQADCPLEIPIGRTSTGELLTFDIAKGPHWVIFGATNSGKSTASQMIISSLLMRHTPDTLRFVLVDTKIVELACYEDIPHLMKDVITDPFKVIEPLEQIDAMARKRYAMFKDNKVRNIFDYNKKMSEPLPYIVVFIEELADIIGHKEIADQVENLIARIVQFARAAGIYMICATQQPTVKVITGVIKANMPSRIAFAVKTESDSRVGMGRQGAEKLLGMGDGLLNLAGDQKLTHFQCAYIDDESIERITAHWKNYQHNKKPDIIIEKQAEVQTVEPVENPTKVVELKKKGQEKQYDTIPNTILKSIEVVKRQQPQAERQDRNPVDTVDIEKTSHAVEQIKEDRQAEQCEEKALSAQAEAEDGERYEVEAAEDKKDMPEVQASKPYDASAILAIYEALDEMTLKVGQYVAAVRYYNQYTQTPILPTVTNMNESLKMKKERLIQSLSNLDEVGVIKKSKTKGRGATTQILITVDESVAVLKKYRPDILKTAEN